MKIQCTLTEFYDLAVKLNGNERECETCFFQKTCSEIHSSCSDEECCKEFLTSIVEIEESTNE